MKNKNWKSVIVFLIALLLVSGGTVKAQFSESREFVRRFRIQPETRIDITNKYGRIELNTWKKDSVVIWFKMEINEKKPDKLKKTLDNLDFDISNSQHFLVVKTQVDKYRSQIESELLKFKETMLQTNGSIRIDLVVWLPDNRELRLENKFGDIILGDYKGETQITLSNGKLKAGDLPGRTSLNLNFADATISSLPLASIVSNYSDIILKNSGSLKLDSKSSTIEIQNSDKLEIDSRRDKYRIRLADQLEAAGNFSHFMVNELRGKANLRTSFGSLDVEKILNSFSSIYIESRSTDVSLYFNPEAKFNYEITESKTDLHLDREMKEEDKEVLDSKENKIRHTGYFGKKMKEEQLIINAVGGEINVISE
ncbi:MAG TPA: hypothetical protein VGK10_16815 [Prolixibacteraceae bacterium]|jgi:hypothetical protein